MEINIGDRVLYTFPNPIFENPKSVTGTVEAFNEFYIIFKTDDNVKLKITFKNFDYLKKITEEELSEITM